MLDSIKELKQRLLPKFNFQKDDLGIYIKRMNDTGKQTDGVLVIFDGELNPLFSCGTLERSWNNNKQNESCIPLGYNYHCVLEFSPAFDKKLWKINGVEKGIDGNSI